MENYIIVILATAALFLAMILQLAAKPKFAAKITGACIVIAGISGLLIYGYGFAFSQPNTPLAIVRALLAVCGIYVGKIDFGAVSSTPIFQNVWAELFFYLVHLCALYATASAAITSVGGEALQKLRLWLARRGQLSVIYGINDDSLEFGKALLSEKNNSVVFIGKAPDSGTISSIIKAGGAVRSDDNALKATEKFLRAVGIRPGSRKITLYTMSRDFAENLPYAKSFLTSLESRGISPEQTTLVIPAAEDAIVSGLQVLGNRYGYGYVTCFRESDLAARVLTKTYPPCDTMDFDEQGNATNNFDALLIGFGKTGQAVLRQLIINGQFVGSSFHADVFSPDCFSAGGYFTSSSSQLLDHYNITFHDCSAHSKEFYSFILGNAHNLNYVVISAGADKNNREIAEDLSSIFHRMGIHLPIYLCTRSGVSTCMPDGTFTKPYKLYQPQVISTHTLDRMAMELNASYMGDDRKTAVEHWMNCDYFSRMSCRAATDFVPAILRAAGKTEEDALRNDWEFSPPQLEVLGHMEHLRWNAFHFCMGFSPMTEEEFDSRAAEYLRQKETMEKPAIRIAKNMAERTHACLIDWQELDALSEKEHRITGKNVDYKGEDIKNILAIPTLIRRSKEEII